MISELENRIIEIAQSEQEGKQTGNKTKQNEQSQTYVQLYQKDLTFVSSKSQKEMRRKMS